MIDDLYFFSLTVVFFGVLQQALRYRCMELLNHCKEGESQKNRCRTSAALLLARIHCPVESYPSLWGYASGFSFAMIDAIFSQGRLSGCVPGTIYATVVLLSIIMPGIRVSPTRKRTAA